MGITQYRRLAGKPSEGGYSIIDPIHSEMRSITWNCYSASAQRATLLSCNITRPMPRSIMVGVKTPVSVLWQVVKARTAGMGLHAAARTFEKATHTILAGERKLGDLP